MFLEVYCFAIVAFRRMWELFNSVSYLPVAASPIPSALDYDPEDMSHYGSYAKLIEDSTRDNNLVASGPILRTRNRMTHYKRVLQDRIMMVNHEADDMMKAFLVPALGFKGSYLDFSFHLGDFLISFGTAKSFPFIMLSCWRFLCAASSLTPTEVLRIFRTHVNYLFDMLIVPILGKLHKVFDSLKEKMFSMSIFNKEWDNETIVPDDVSEGSDDDLDASMDGLHGTFFDKVNRLLSERGNFSRSDFARRISSFVGAIICLPFFRKRKIDLVKLGFKESFNKRFLKENDKVHPLQIYDSIMQDTLYFIEKVTCVVKSGGKLHHIYVDDEEAYKYEKEYNLLTYFYNKLEVIESYKDKAGNKMTLAEYLTRVDLCIEENKRLMKAFKQDKEMLMLFKKQSVRLEECSMHARAKMGVSAKREAPIGICLYGPPGIGKSDLIDKLMTICYQNEMFLGHGTKPYNKELKYVYNQTDEFMSEYRVSKEVCVLDDVDQFKKDINDQMKGGALAKTIEFVNVTPYVTNQAELSAKGMIPFLSKYVILTTNTQNAGLHNVFQSTSGAYRRYLFIDVVVKQEYQKIGQTQLDIRNNRTGEPIDEWNHELHEFRPRKYLNSNGQNSEVYWIKSLNRWSSNVNEVEPLSLRELQRFMCEEIQKPHYFQRDIAEKSTENFIATEFCNICCVSRALCDCDNVASMFGTDKTRKAFIKVFGYSGAMRLGKALAEDKIDELKCVLSDRYKAQRQRYLLKSGAMTFIVGIGIIKGIIWFKNYFLTKHNKAASANPWVKTHEPINVYDVNRIGLFDLERLCESNLVTVNYVVKGVKQSIRCFGIYGTTAIMPLHWYKTMMMHFPKGEFKVDFIRHDLVHARGASCKNVILDSSSFIFDIGGHEVKKDFCLLNHINLGLFRDVRKYFTDDIMKGVAEAHVIQRSPEGVTCSTKVSGLRYVEDFHYSVDYLKDKVHSEGYFGSCNYEVIPLGTCGSPYIIDAPKGAYIVGIHIASNIDKGKYYAQRISKDDLYVIEPMSASAPLNIDLQGHYETKKDITISPKIHSRDPISQVEGTLEVFGTIPDRKPNLKTQVCDTIMHDDVLKHYGLLENTHFPPINISRTKCFKDVMDLVASQNTWPPRYVERAEMAVYANLIKVMQESELPIPTQPWDRLTAINGMDGIDYCDRLPVNTSGGFQHTGRKDQYFIDVGSQPGHEVCYDLNEDVMKEYNRLVDCYQRGERGMIVWNYTYKDEPISAKKLKDSKVRIFSCGPLHFNVLFRQYFGPFIPYFSGKDRLKLNQAIGANAFGKDWADIYKKLVKLGFTRIGDADFKFYDKTTAAQFMAASLGVEYKVARDFLEWNDFHLKNMVGLMTDLCHAIINGFGTIFQVRGKNQSGQPFTTICNGLGGVMMYLCSIMDICDEFGYEHPDYNNYQDTISLLTYGDDSCFSTNDARFNMKSISRAMAKYGMTMTMADKDAEMTEFVPIDKVSFLKRGFKTGYHEVFEVAAPLEEASIIKSLHVCTKSKEISFPQQCAEIILSANMEYFQYPKKKFLKENLFLNSLLDKYNLRCYLKDGKLPSYEDFIAKFKEDDLVCSMEPIVGRRNEIQFAEEVCKKLGCAPGNYLGALTRLSTMQNFIDKSHPHYVFRLNRVTAEFLYPLLRNSFRLRIEGIAYLREDGLRPLKMVLRHFGDKYTIGGRYKTIFEMVSVFRYSDKGVYLSVQMAELYLEMKRHKLGCMAPSCKRKPAMALKYFAMSIFYDYCMCLVKLKKQAAAFNCTSPSCFNDDVCVCIPPDGDCLDSRHNCEGDYTCECPPTPMSEYITDDEDLVASMETTPSSDSSKPVPHEQGDDLVPQTNTVFADERNVSIMSYSVNYINNLFSRSMSPMADIQNFLKRPVLIRTQTWQVGVDFAAYQMNPWALWSANAAVARKLANFTLISGNLHIRIMVNGTPFHYGRVLCGVYMLNQNMTRSVGPLTADVLENFLPAGSVSWQPTKTFYTQRPHILVNPTKNVTNVIEWPFMTDSQFEDVFDTAHFHMGFLEVWPLNTLRQANGNTDPVEITFWAHMENCVLSGINPVAAMETIPEDDELVASMAGRSDEYGKRLVSATATSVARAATQLASVPIIGPFARATEIGATAVAGIASIFGWSRPTNLETPCQVFRVNMGNMPNTSGCDNVVRLGLDPKGELTVDPKTVGLSEVDEMSFKYIAQREALIYTQPWATSGALISSGRLIAMRVSPLIFPKIDDGAVRFYHQTPMGAITLPFQFWTGSIVFRIQVVCSAMHKGRLGIVYQPRPNNFMSATVFNPAEHFNYIIDIAKETDVSFEISYQQYYAWANADLDLFDYTRQDGIALTDTNNSSNGFLGIYVVNRLTSPIDASTVDINIYVRAGDDFRVATPASDFSEFSYFGGAIFSLPNASMEPIIEELGDDDNLIASMEHTDCGMAQFSDECAPVQVTSYQLNPTGGYNGSEISEVYMGEHIESVRALCKRYQPYTSITKMGPSATLNFVRRDMIELPNMPNGRSIVVYGSSGDDGYHTFGNVSQTYLRHFMQGYAGWRGSIRYKWIYTTNTHRPFVTVRRRNTTNVNNDIVITQTDTNSTATAEEFQELLNVDLKHMIGGGQAYASMDSQTLAYELPFYTQWRMARGTANGSSVRSRPSGLSHVVMFYWPPASVVTQNSNFASLFAAAGEDFQLLFFQGFPPVVKLPDQIP